MRIRSTKPEFWRSKTIAALDWDVRFVLKGLESYVDDNGVGKDDIALIAADVFPRDLSRDPRETLARLSEAISALSEAGLIVRYEMDGDDLVYIDRWKDIQRVDKPNKGRFRRPDGTMEYLEPVNRDSYRDPRGTFARTSETLAPGTEEQRNRGTEEQLEDDRARLEPPPDTEPPAEIVIVDQPPQAENAAKPSRPQPTNAARTVVRQELSDANYPRATIDRLAVQVSKLAREGHPDKLIRESLREWDRRENCDRPEFLPTVYGDVVKRSRAEPGHNGKPPHKLRVIADLARQARADENAQLETATVRKELT
jgi:hypothetical protein